MRTLRGFALVVWAAPQRVVHMDPFDHQDFVFDVDIATSFGGKAAFAGIDPARFQRAPKCSAESTSRRCYEVIKGCGVIRILARCGAVVLAHFVVGAENNRLCLTWKGGLPDRSALAHDAHSGYVSRFLLNHGTRLHKSVASRISVIAPLGFGVRLAGATLIPFP